MSFSQTLEAYLDLRDELKHEEDNFNSIDDCSRARKLLAHYARELDEIVDQNTQS